MLAAAIISIAVFIILPVLVVANAVV